MNADDTTEQPAQATLPAAPRGVAVPRPERRGWLPSILVGLGSLLKGMGVTLRYLVRPSSVVTEQYPENRATLRLAERARTMLSFIYEENGQHRCTACRSCEKACPNRSIVITSRKGPVSGRNEVDHFVWRLDSCTFCNMCVLVCPFNALTMSGSFEAAVYDRRLLVYSLNRYAGPTASALAKVASEEERRRLMEPRTPYSGPVPLNGVPFAGIPGTLAPGGAPEKERLVNVIVLNAVLFYVLSAGAIGLALAVVLSRQILRSAVFLMGTLGFIAGLYVVLSAQFLAAVQVLVYIGGIVVLFVLAVMLSSNTELLDDVPPPGRRLMGLLVSIVYLGLNIAMCAESPFVGREPGAAPADTAALARSFLGRGPDGYLVPFELLSLLILGAAVGGIVLARKTPPPDGSAGAATGDGKEPPS